MSNVIGFLLGVLTGSLVTGFGAAFYMAPLLALLDCLREVLGCPDASPEQVWHRVAGKIGFREYMERRKP